MEARRSGRFRRSQKSYTAEVFYTKGRKYSKDVEEYYSLGKGLCRRVWHSEDRNCSSLLVGYKGSRRPHTSYSKNLLSQHSQYSPDLCTFRTSGGSQGIYRSNQKRRFYTTSEASKGGNWRRVGSNPQRPADRRGSPSFHNVYSWFAHQRCFRDRGGEGAGRNRRLLEVKTAKQYREDKSGQTRNSKRCVPIGDYEGDPRRLVERGKVETEACILNKLSTATGESEKIGPGKGRWYTLIQAESPPRSCEGIPRNFQGRNVATQRPQEVGQSQSLHRPRTGGRKSHRDGEEDSAEDPEKGRATFKKERVKKRDIYKAKAEVDKVETPGNAGSVMPSIKSRRRRARRAANLRMSQMEQQYGDIELDLYKPEGIVADDGSGPLDDVVTATVNLEVIESWGLNPKITEVRELTEKVETFEENILDAEGVVPLPGAKSRLTAEQVADMERAGVIVKHSYQDEPVKNVVGAFTVPKPNGNRRLVVNAGRLSDAMEEPPYSLLPSIESIQEAAQSSSHMVQLDGKSWFYQIPAMGIAPYFALRTIIGVYWLVVLAMGWSWSVWIAQTVAATIMKKALLGSKAKGLVYIDNFILLGSTSQEATDAKRRLEVAAAECGAIFKNEGGEVEEEGEVLGMKLNLKEKEVSLQHSWRMKLLQYWEFFKRKPSEKTLQQTWKLLGSLFWAMRILKIPQLKVIHLKQFISRRARELSKGVKTWNDLTGWWNTPWKEVKWLIDAVRRNVPVSISLPKAVWVDTLWADASGKGGAYILEADMKVKNWEWTPLQKEAPIHIKEAWATERGVKDWVCRMHESVGLKIKTDSQLVYWALKCKKATGFIFSSIILKMVELLAGRSWEVEWVPSAENIADSPSRVFG